MGNTQKTVEDKTLGVLKLNDDRLEGKIQWMGREIEIWLTVDPADETTWTRMREAMAGMVDKQEAWNEDLQDMACECLLDQANDWYCDALAEEDPDIDLDEIPDITEEEFCQRIELESITLELDGSFTAWYADGDLFGGHSIQVTGTLEDGADSAHI